MKKIFMKMPHNEFGCFIHVAGYDFGSDYGIRIYDTNKSYVTFTVENLYFLDKFMYWAISNVHFDIFDRILLKFEGDKRYLPADKFFFDNF